MCNNIVHYIDTGQNSLLPFFIPIPVQVHFCVNEAFLVNPCLPFLNLCAKKELNKNMVSCEGILSTRVIGWHNAKGGAKNFGLSCKVIFNSAIVLLQLLIILIPLFTTLVLYPWF